MLLSVSLVCVLAQDGSMGNDIATSVATAGDGSVVAACDNGLPIIYKARRSQTLVHTQAESRLQASHLTYAILFSRAIAGYTYGYNWNGDLEGIGDRAVVKLDANETEIWRWQVL